MKKYIIGFLTGVLIASAIPTYAAVSSMIGKEVQAENTVIVNGQELTVKSVNIDGMTYTPNRALAEALGMDIKFEDNTVIFEEKVTALNEGQTTTTAIDMTPEDAESIRKAEEQIQKLKSKIDENNEKITELDGKIEETGDPLEMEFWKTQKETAQSVIDMNTTAITQLQAYIEKIKAKYATP